MTRELSTTEKAEAYDRLVREIGYRSPTIWKGLKHIADAEQRFSDPVTALLYAYDKAIDRLKRAKLN